MDSDKADFSILNSPHSPILNSPLCSKKDNFVVRLGEMIKIVSLEYFIKIPAFTNIYRSTIGLLNVFILVARFFANEWIK